MIHYIARNEELGKSAVEKLKSEGVNPVFHQLDILSSESIQCLKGYLEKTYGGLDLLINNAGIAYKVKIHAQLNFLIHLFQKSL